MAAANSCTYTGRAINDENGLYYHYRNRYYHAQLGRFVTRDPIAVDQNLYVYVGGNPLGDSDPFGLFKWGLYDIPPSPRKCAIVALALMVGGSSVDLDLWGHWLVGKGKPMTIGMDKFDTAGSERSYLMQLANAAAGSLARDLTCGETKEDVFAQGAISLVRANAGVFSTS